MEKLTLRQKIKNAISNTWIIWETSLSRLLRKFYPQQHQLTSTTSPDRYPELFTEAAKACRQQTDGFTTILSYGCSTGEECFSLNKYFKKAKIIGVDINKLNLKKAIQKNVYPGI